jgi:hypothetical protein
LRNKAAADLGRVLPGCIWRRAEKPSRRHIHLADIRTCVHRCSRCLKSDIFATLCQRLLAGFLRVCVAGAS